MSADRSDMLEDDLEKIKDLRGSDGMDMTIPAIAELVFATLTALTAIVWLAALYWTPEPISGQDWMLGGVVGLGMFGGPAAATYFLRRGGAGLIMDFVREVSR